MSPRKGRAGQDNRARQATKGKESSSRTLRLGNLELLGGKVKVEEPFDVLKVGGFVGRVVEVEGMLLTG